jgi:hypothetical protein
VRLEFAEFTEHRFVHQRDRGGARRRRDLSVPTATVGTGGIEDVTSLATWTSSNTAVAAVSPTGIVTSLASGTAVISATFSGVAGADSITVP